MLVACLMTSAGVTTAPSDASNEKFHSFLDPELLSRSRDELLGRETGRCCERAALKPGLPILRRLFLPGPMPELKVYVQAFDEAKQSSQESPVP